MAYTPISLLVPQYINGDTGQPYSGAVLKAYKANTSTLLQMATDNTGNTPVDDMVLNADGYPEVSSNIVIPHLDQSFKLALYPTQTAADSDTGAVWIIDNLTPTGIGAAQTERVTTVTNLRNYTGQADTVILLGESGATDGSAAIYQKKTGSPAGTYTHDGERVILPTGGDGSEAWVRADMDISVKSDVDTHDEDYTFVRNDAGKTLIKTASDTTTRTWTIPLESSVNYPVGTSIRVVNLDNNNLTLVADSTATLRALDGDTPADGNVTVPEGASGVVYKDGADTWIFYRIGNVDTSSPQTLTNKIISASQITEISNLTAAEGAQIENINSVTISNTQWGYVGGADQPTKTTDTPTFDGAILTDAPQIDIPVSTTSSGGTTGINYDVADWPGTLVSGRTYYFRAHISNIAIPSIEGMSVVYPGGGITPPNTIRTGGIYGVRVSGTSLVLTNPSLNIDSHSISSISGGDDWTRVCRIFASTGERCIVKLRFMRNDGAAEMMDAYVVVDDADDKVAITTKVIGDNSRLKHNRVGAYFSGTDEVIIYFSSETGSGLFTFVPEIIEYLDPDIQIQYFENQGAGTEAGITGGTFDVVSRPAEGELEKQQYRASNLDAAGEVTRLCRVTLPNASTTDSIGFRLLLHDVTRNAATPKDDWEAVIACRQNAVFGSAPEVSIATRELTQAIGLTHSKLHAHVVDNTGPTIIDFYIEHHNAATDWVFRVDDIALGDTDARIELFDSDGVTTEATVTGGSWDVSSQAARGESVTIEHDTGNLSSGVNDEYTLTHNLGTNDVKIENQVEDSGTGDGDMYQISSLTPVWDSGALTGVRQSTDFGPGLSGSDISSLSVFSNPSNGEVRINIINRHGSQSQKYNVYTTITVI